MRRIVATWLMVAVASTLALGAASPRKRVAILDFDYATVQRWWEGTWDIGKGISDMIVTELVTDGTYSVIERKRLDAVLAEQNFSNSERANPTSAAQIGKILGVTAIIVGSITQFGTEKKGFSIGGLGGRFGGFGGGKFGTQKGQAKVAVDARMVDVNTGEILAVAKGTGLSERSGLLLAGVGAGGGGFGAGGVSMSSSDFRETILGEAVTSAVGDLSSQLVKLNDRIAATKIEIRDLVADVDASWITLNVGSDHGIEQDSVLDILRVTRTTKDPASGKVLREVTAAVGQLRITEVGEAFSVGTLISGSGVQVGDQVRSP